MNPLRVVVLLVVLICLTPLYAKNSVEALYDKKCLKCHVKRVPKHLNSIVAPSVMGVMRQVKTYFPKKEEAVAFIVDYVFYPERYKSICLPRGIKKFGLMPSLRGQVSEAELKKIASWMFDHYPDGGYLDDPFEALFEEEDDSMYILR